MPTALASHDPAAGTTGSLFSLHPILAFLTDKPTPENMGEPAIDSLKMAEPLGAQVQSSPRTPTSLYTVARRGVCAPDHRQDTPSSSPSATSRNGQRPVTLTASIARSASKLFERHLARLTTAAPCHPDRSFGTKADARARAVCPRQAQGDQPGAVVRAQGNHRPHEGHAGPPGRRSQGGARRDMEAPVLAGAT